MSDSHTIARAAMQLTFAIIKPHAVRNPWTLQWIRRALADHQFTTVRRRRLQFSEQLAAEFYAEHRGKFFYNRLHTFMCRWGTKFILI